MGFHQVKIVQSTVSSPFEIYLVSPSGTYTKVAEAYSEGYAQMIYELVKNHVHKTQAIVNKVIRSDN